MCVRVCGQYGCAAESKKKEGGLREPSSIRPRTVQWMVITVVEVLVHFS